MVVFDSVKKCRILGKTAVAIGYFDGMHLGHRKIIETACEFRTRGLQPCVFTFRTEMGRPGARIPDSKRGKLRLLSDEDKIKIAEEMGVAYYFCPDFAEIAAMSARLCVEDILCTVLHAGAVVVGQDFRFGAGAGGDVMALADLCRENHMEPLILEKRACHGETISSSVIRGYLETGRVEQANQMLGYPYFYDLTVCTGNQIGGPVLSFPTANQVIPPGFVLPLFGVYASYCHTGGKVYPAVTNIGVKPTVGSEMPIAETHLIGFCGDLYGKNIKVELVSFLRTEKKFDTLAALKVQIGKDRDAAYAILTGSGPVTG